MQVLTNEQIEPGRWDAFVAQHPDAHILQSHGWGELKGRFGWRSSLVALAGREGKLAAGALLLFRRVAGLTLAYVPKGPLTDWHDRSLTTELLAAMEQVARRSQAAFLKIEPDLLDTPSNRALLAAYGFRPSSQTVQPRSTVWLDIGDDEDRILSRMKSKWRYNVRLAQRKAVTVRSCGREDLASFNELMQVTGERDDFAVHSSDYYAAAYELFAPSGQGAFLMAEFQEQPLAFIVVFAAGRRAWYLWGASSDRERSRMPNHALQWAAIQWARARGAVRYDLWGIPDEIGQLALGMSRGRAAAACDDLPVDMNALPAGELWGVFRFKQGFGGEVVRYVGAWDLPISPLGYGAYRLGLGLRQAWSRVARRRISERKHLSESFRCPGGAERWRAVRDPGVWRDLLSQLPDPHVLQSWEWGEVKAAAGWQAERLAVMDSVESGDGSRARMAVQFLCRQPISGLPLRIGYVPKGPVLDWADPALVEDVLARIEAHARRKGCAFVKIDPDVREDGAAGKYLLQTLKRRGWRLSRDQIQFKNTAYSRLDGDEEALLAGMKSKWRYNIRLAERRGIQVRPGGPADFEAFYQLYAETGQRDGFVIRSYGYYRQVWRTFLDAQAQADNSAGGILLLAEPGPAAEETTDVRIGPVAGLFLLRYGRRAWYFYGASGECRRRDMPNYLLQWEALRWARSQGCALYDWWGAPDEPENNTDPLQGVWRFKQGFGAKFQPHVGAWDWPISPLVYRLFMVSRSARKTGLP